MKVLILGGGGREHALAWKLAQSSRISTLQCAPGNAGIAKQATCVNIPLQPPFEELKRHCANEKIDLVVVGPEAPLVHGVSDILAKEKIPCFGPSQEAAQLEGSKSFTRKLTDSAGIPTHAWQAFDNAKEAQAFYRSNPAPWWIKADGLAAGKGAVMPESIEAGLTLLESWLDKGGMGEAGQRVVIEEPLSGPEVSIIAFASGETARLLTPSQDHKRHLDNDQGPNTGGMGAYAPSLKLSPEQLEDIQKNVLVPTLRELRKRDMNFQGILYAGIMITEQGPRLLEYNIRLGDPEAQVILPQLENDLVDVIEAVVEGKLDSITINKRAGAAVNVVASAHGYPSSPRKGDTIQGLEEAEATLGNSGVIFHAGTKRVNGQILTNGGRVLGVTAWGNTLETARERSYQAIEKIQWPGMHYRQDIATS